MTDPSQGRKKRKITIIASPIGVEIAENALIRLGFDSKSNFAKSQLLARNTVTKFFQREPIQPDSFKRICEALKLDWKEIAGITEEEQSEQLEKKDCSSPDANEEVESVQTLRRQVKIKSVITLEGDINSVQNLKIKIIELILRENSGDTIEITHIKEGSIKLFIEGSPEDIERLVSRIKSGEIITISGFPVEDIQILSESSDDDESTEFDDKWRLVQEIISQPVEGRNLSGVDLSDADLSGANLRGADLSGANLRGADLSDADLRDADLRDADLSDANVKNARSGNNLGISEPMKRDLIQRGAIFEDFRSGVLGLVVIISLFGLIGFSIIDENSRSVFLDLATVIIGVYIGYLIPTNRTNRR